LHPPSGCAFHTRCPLVTDLCRGKEPLLQATAHGTQVACHSVVEGGGA
jgi:peptide/nickel transport system ATP-binding protein